MNYFLSTPVNPPRGGLLVLHAWWGLNDFIKKVCNQLADRGYLTIAPDLYNGKVAATVEQAEKLRNNTKPAVFKKEILSAFDLLSARPEFTNKSVGVIGLSLGAWWSLWLNEQKPDQIAATILFYGARGMKSTATQSAFLGHFAGQDPYQPGSGVKRLEKTLRNAGKECEFHTYHGTAHWFFEEDRPEYQPQAAKLAWTRTQAFIDLYLQNTKEIR